ncbi:MAG: hypothetical protein K1000chlam2_00929 [Chlamydiae bacterium]|nr:hypothetical protein [Chlamydiota bacterium]
MTQPTTLAPPNLQDLQGKRDCQILAAEKRTQSTVEGMKGIACTIAAFATGIFSLIFFIEFTEELLWVFSSCSLLTLGAIQIVSFTALAYFASQAIQRFGDSDILHNQARFIDLRQQEITEQAS